ncbi:MAG: hypothetical protein DLM58_22660 [Pseudonocardiales bacterium]|nr:MAG: hypothetical protein DLM58_22660 [Pseudonocardiales bacterium]
MSNQYGALSEVVSVATSLMAVAGAIGLAWRGRAIPVWAPQDEEVPDGAQKVAGVLAAAGIAYEWAGLRKPSHIGTLNVLLLVFGCATLAGLLAYTFLKGTRTVVAKVTLPHGGTKDVQVISGFRPTQQAAQQLKTLTMQDVFAGALYEPDRVWTRESRGLAKMAILVSYIALTACGTLLLATAALRIITAVS